MAKPSEILVESLRVSKWVKEYFGGKTVIAIYLAHSKVDVKKRPFGLEVCMNFGPKKVEKVRQALIAVGLPDITSFHGSQKTENEIRVILDSEN